MKIYTKTGDKGETSLFTGQRVSKRDLDALGTIDEVNCALGVALGHLPRGSKYDEVCEQLITIQHTLFDLGAALATPLTRAKAAKISKTRFDSEGTALLEKWIDSMEEHLPKLHTFILPGGSLLGAHLHLARSISRRAERLIVPIHQQGDVSDDVLMYINRLSDYLFVCSRYVNHLTHTPEVTWEHHKAG